MVGEHHHLHGLQKSQATPRTITTLIAARPPEPERISKHSNSTGKRLSNTLWSVRRKLVMWSCTKEWQAGPDCTILGPEPPDACWLDAGLAWQGRGHAADGYLALYHDQGLIPTKLIAFDDAVNTTLGLPFIRTSPDHGTAFSLAGQGLAREGSMVAALLAAAELQPLPTLVW